MEFMCHVYSWTIAACCYLFYLGLVLSTVPSPEDITPSQLRLTFGDTPQDIVVMAATKANCSSTVWYGKDYYDLDTSVPARTEQFGADQMNPDGLQFLHRAKLQNLDAGTNYFYVVFCDKSVQSKKMSFKVPPSKTDWSPQFLVYGDLGLETESMPALQTEAHSGKHTAVLHLGDMAYELESDGGKRGDQFMDMIEPVAGQLPYLTTPGNHEVADDTFYQYRYRFSTPQAQWPIPLEKMWYSIDIGPVHLISYSTEVFNMTDKQYISKQRDWLVSDLKRANGNRHFRPWIIVFSHQPMYCSTLGGHDCSREKSVIRQNLEDIFFQQSVDLVLNAHEHAYERLWPTYKGTVHATNYTNPTAPVTIITGPAGNHVRSLAPEEEYAKGTFVHYRYRFSTPGVHWPIPLNKMWYSLDIGPVHLVSYSSEVYNLSDQQYVSAQRDWLISDLKSANQNRNVVPWIIAFAHKPMYCSTVYGTNDCNTDKFDVRESLEAIFFDQSVDLMLGGHVHSYERLWPTYKGNIYSKNYSNPRAPVTVISGAAGTRFRLDPMQGDLGPFTAFRMTKDSGSQSSYGSLEIMNKTHLYWKQVSVIDGHVIDSFWLSQCCHGDFLHPAAHKIPSTPEDTSNYITNVKDILRSNKGLVIAVTSVASVLLLIGCICVFMRCRKRPSVSRRWQVVDYDRSFYSGVETTEDDLTFDDPEPNGNANDPLSTSKLLSTRT